MKNSLTKLLVSIVIFNAPLASNAGEKEESLKATVDLPTYTIGDIAALPEPTKHSLPQVSKRIVGMKVNVKFTVDVNGRPQYVRLEKALSSYSDLDKMTFASQMENAVKNWKFEPAIDTQGNPIAVAVVLPVEVIKKGARLSTIAALVLDTQFQNIAEEEIYLLTNI